MAIGIGDGAPTGPPSVLFEGNYILASGVQRHYDLSPDGPRFLMMKPGGGSVDSADATAGASINIVLNWFEELKERVPVQ